VPKYTIVDDIPYRPVVETWDYPKAGDPNPTVRLGIVGSAGGTVRWVDTGKYASIEFLIVNVAWTPTSQSVAYQVQNREQTWLDLNLADRASGASTTVLRESSKTWVDENGSPTWLTDGSFLWLSERSGWRHVYRHKADGSLVKQITDGKWEVRTLHGIDQAGGWIYFSGTERSPIGRDVYRVRLDGTGLQRLSSAAGTHTARFGPSYTFYLDTWSDVTTPPQVRVHRSDGSQVRVIDANPVAALGQYRLAKPEFMQVGTRDGFLMEAMMIRPPDFNPSQRYPVYQFTYGGPHTQLVLNAWGGNEFMFHQMLAQRGIIVWICDNRTASGKGAESTWPVYRNFGEIELRDVEDGLAWLSKQPYVDRSRIGIHGWSYGGYLTAYALTHSTTFAMGIAGGTVSDWRDYDSIYTERYMGLPQDNPEGYRKSAPRFAATDLHGRILLIHGTIDENVHPQNTLQFAYELQKANKPFQMMLYPKSRHGITEPQLVRHMRGVMFDFIMANLRPGDTITPSPSR
jgi:dipeptidyl-peptidase-4